MQLAVTATKSENLSRAAKFIKDAALNGTKVIVLPENFNAPLGPSYFLEYAEKIPGPSTDALIKAAKENKIFLIGGSIPEEDCGKLCSTCTVFSPEGQMIAKHRKVHLFDINIPGKIYFQESETLSPGNSFTSFETPFCRFGIGICYDMCFAEMAQTYAREGCNVLVYPSAFNMFHGLAYWKFVPRMRALDNQVFVAAVSFSRDEKASFVSWGHSTVISPDGGIIASAGHEEALVYADIDLSLVETIRNQFAVVSKRRNDLSDVVRKDKEKHV